MLYQHVCLESFGYTLPDEVLTSAQIEGRLAPLYTRLGLPEGRLELMTGIRQRRLWAPGTLPSQPSIASAEKAIRAAGIDKRDIGVLIHASVCRDHLEPATACRVHQGLALSPRCQIYDVSNACLGILNGVIQLANMIELGQVKAGVVVGTESCRPLLETTIEALNADTSLTRQSVKPAMASLTIGSASAAIVLVDGKLSRTGNRLLGGVVRANTDHHALCHSGRDESIAGDMRPLMQTDSEGLLHQGVQTAVAAWDDFQAALAIRADEIDKTFCHQVGVAHRKLLFEALRLPPSIDFTTVEFLGNTGSAALPVTAAIGIEQGHLRTGDQVALLGIGSGINVVMLAIEWQGLPV